MLLPNPDTINKYEYIIKLPIRVRLMYAVGFLTWSSVIYGYYNFIKLAPLYTYFLGPLVIFFTIYYFISYYIGIHYKGFSIDKHLKISLDYFTTTKNLPSVDIFLPICGEELEVLENTWKHVSKLNYSNLNVYVLDDKNKPECEDLARLYGFSYISRPNRGEMKKAGNLKYAFDRTHGDFIVILDADFAPHPDFIKETLPYMQNTEVAIVQTPQYFDVSRPINSQSKLQYGAGQVQEDFYRIIQVSRDHFGAAICVGSNALYRRKALDMVGGTAQIEYSEDVHTGVSLTKLGWKLKYIPVILAIGICPQNVHSFFLQQHRWCMGSMSLLGSKSFWRSKLTFTQKLCFTSGFLYYISQIGILILTLQSFLIIFTHYDKINILNVIPFIPALLYGIIIRDRFRIKRKRFGSFYTRTIFMYAYIHAIISRIFKITVGWVPTNEKNVKISDAFIHFNSALVIYTAVYVLLFGCIVFLKRFNILSFHHSSLNIWIAYFLSVNLLFLYFITTEYTVLKFTSEAFKTLKRKFIYKIGIATSIAACFCAGASIANLYLMYQAYLLS